MQQEIQDVAYKALQGEEIISNPFYEDFVQNKIFCYGVPVYQNKQIIGALIASIQLNPLTESIEREKISDENADIHIIDKNGNFLTSPSNSFVKEDDANIFENSYLSDDILSNVKKDIKNSEISHFTFTYEEKEYNVLLVPFDLNGWYLLTINSVDDSASKFYLITNIVVVFLMAIVVLVISVFLYSYHNIKKNNKLLMDIAYHDRLTGIYNLNRFGELVQSYIKHHPKYSIAVFDVCKFKFINELFGKTEADKLLKYIAKIILDNTYKNEFICRDNADIFYMFITDTQKEKIENRLIKILDNIEACSGRVNSDYKITVNCGVAISNPQQNLQTVITHAIFALKYVKTNPRLRLWFFDPALHEQEKTDNYIESNMHNALKAGEFKVYLQPKIDLTDNSLYSAEALVRWKQSNGSMLFPSQFIPIFEKTGFCIDLDMYMIEKVCQLLHEWINNGYKVIPISINQSKLVFYEEAYVKNLCAILNKYNIPASLIILEILEDTASEDIDHLNIKLSELRNIGFNISMDDFGSGYSSLNTLAKLNIDELKLDRNFLLSANDSKNKKNYLVMEEIVKLSRKLFIKSVVEGVETEQDNILVKQMGFDYGQGYYYGRPIDSDDFTEKYIKP